MDNLTHSLIGLGIAETAIQTRKSKIRGPLYVASLVANNFPDIDFVYASLISKPLGYLLHHRGHTHTLVMILPQALLILLAMALFSRRKKEKWSSKDWGTMVFLVFCGLFVHILLDALNSYGVHPFWPFQNAWYYLDSVFILEPLFWLALTPALFFAAERKLAKAAFAGLFAGALLLVFKVDVIPFSLKIAYSIAAAAFLFSGYCFSPAQRSLLSLCYCVIFASTLVIISQGVEGSVHTYMEQANPDEEIVDVVRSPFPGNPLCWNIHAIGTDSQKSKYWIRTGFLRLPITPHSPRFCTPFFEGSPNIPLQEVNGDTFAQSAGITWRGIYERPLTELQSLERSSCQFSAFLRFSRAPFWISGQDSLYFGDIRFDRDASKGFAEFEQVRNSSCPRQLPAWRPPLQELLGVLD